MGNTQRKSEYLTRWLGHRRNHVLLCCATTIAFAAVVLVGHRGTIFVDATTPPSPAAERRLNPNTAQWWELAELPGLGESLAGQIVAYRQERRASMSTSGAVVFRKLADLQRVRGIGPAKAAAIEPLLVFPD